MRSSIYIIGLGIISAIGDGVQETLKNLKAQQTGIGTATILDARHLGHLPTGEVKLTNTELTLKSGLKDYQTRTAHLSMIAAREAKHSVAIDYTKWRCGFISANTIGGMDRTEGFFDEYMKEGGDANLHDVINHDSGEATEIVADQLGCNDFITTISTACSSSVNSIIYASRLIENGLLDIAIAGGADAMARFTINGFNSLMILDGELCQPFDKNRRGLNLGEGAGYIVLASKRVIEANVILPMAQISGYANANDVYHQTASSPEGNGNYQAMKGALDMARLDPDQIDYINLHGTGTENNDRSEAVAISRLFGANPPAHSSTKPYTGHTLGACGGIESILSILAIQQGLVHPNLRFRTQMEEISFSPNASLLINQRINHVLSNSFGFGGNCSSIIFSRV